MSKVRLVARIGQVPVPPRTRHTMLRPGGTVELMPPPQVVLMEVEANGPAQVYRYTLDGTFAGDTWHEDRQRAERTLAFEYGEAVGPWSQVPDDVADAHDFAASWAGMSPPGGSAGR
jgi:hypothetical protein